MEIGILLFCFGIFHRPGTKSSTADPLSHSFCRVSYKISELQTTGNSATPVLFAWCISCIQRTSHSPPKTLKWSLVIATIKPVYCSIYNSLIKAKQTFERLSIDFKGPLNYFTRSDYLYFIVGEHSCFPFAFACFATTPNAIIFCPCKLISISLSAYIYSSDRWSPFYQIFLTTMASQPAKQRRTILTPTVNMGVRTAHWDWSHEACLSVAAMRY